MACMDRVGVEIKAGDTITTDEAGGGVTVSSNQTYVGRFIFKDTTGKDHRARACTK